MPRTTTLILALAVSMLAAACSTSHKTTTPMPTIAPPATQAMPQDQKNPGSLFDSASADYLFSDNRARKVGDIVLINIVESASATNSAETTADKESNNNFGVSALLGNTATGILPFGSGFLAGEVGEDAMIGTNSENDFEGTGETTRENTFSATIAARVVNVLPGGLMQVQGAREIRVNGETQVMVVQGLVRPRDIGSDNAINSTHLADARIEYYGQGVIADKQKPGWMTRLLDNVWPW
jgi:flagellar L-ring protein precursor FlgH